MFHNIMTNEWQIYEGRHRWIVFSESIPSRLVGLVEFHLVHNVLWSDWGLTAHAASRWCSAAPPTADSLRKPAQALLSLYKLVLPPSLTRTRGGLTLIQRRRNKSLEGTTVITNWGFYLCYVSTQEATGGSDNDRNISETPSKIGHPEISRSSQPISWRTESALHTIVYLSHSCRVNSIKCIVSTVKYIYMAV